MQLATLNNPGTVLIDDLAGDGSGRTYLFVEPESVIIARSPDEVNDALEALDRALASGLHAAGYISYEAGLTLDKPIGQKHPSDLPLIWLGVYRDRTEIEPGQVVWGEHAASDVRDIRLNIETDEYLNCIHTIRDYIAAGDVYQVNYTCKLLFEHARPASALFAHLRSAHPVGHSAFINAGDFQIASLSPELFLRRNEDYVLTRPMKGTARRGRWFEEDESIARDLASDEKNRAENVMILDLMRNDIGRVSRAGGVSVPRMFHVERYGSVFQMTSDAEGRLRDGVSTSALLRAVFPPGSITGAPKIRAMEIINDLEHEARGVYCGCVGMFAPGGDCLLNVAIRTIVQRGEQCEMGVGSGIVIDSDPEAELRETLLKGKFLNCESIDFQLLETLLYERGVGYKFLNEHMERMSHSAQYFGWRFPKDRLIEAIGCVSEAMERTPGTAARVRLLLSRNGEVHTEWTDLETPSAGPVKLLISDRKTDPDDVFLYHKTTRRQAYDDDLRAARKAGYFEVLYMNSRGELTECATMNIVLELDGQWFTPPLECGLLPGIWRGSILAEGRAIEHRLTLADLGRATRILIGNSVRGAIPAQYL